MLIFLFVEDTIQTKYFLKMSYYYCDICDRRVKYLDTPLYKALFKCLINIKNFLN